MTLGAPAIKMGPVAKPARRLERGLFALLAAELIALAFVRSVRWPKAPNALGNALRRMANNLRAAGIEIQFSRADVRGRRLVSLVSASEPRKRSSVTVSDRQ